MTAQSVFVIFVAASRLGGYLRPLSPSPTLADGMKASPMLEQRSRVWRLR